MNRIVFVMTIRLIAFLFVLFVLPVTGRAQVVEKISPNEYGRWLVDGIEIELSIGCRISESGFLPEKYCSEPSVFIRKNLEKEQNTASDKIQYFEIVAKNIELGDRWIFDGSENSTRRLPFGHMTVDGVSSVNSVELFKLLMSKENLEIKLLTKTERGDINSRIFILTDFKSRADEEIKITNSIYDSKERVERVKLIAWLVVMVIFWVMVFRVIRFLFKRIYAKITALTEQIETKRVSRVAEDEAIRMVVRDSVQKADDQSLDTLRNQIKVALDAGDTKTAQELLRIMSHLEGK